VAIEFKISDLVGGFFTAGAATFFLTAMKYFPFCGVVCVLLLFRYSLAI